MTFIIAIAATFVACFILVPVIFWLLRFFGFYAIVEERTCYVYVLFGKVVACYRRAGLAHSSFQTGVEGARLCAGLGNSMSWICGSIRSICAASRSIPRKARRWGSGSGMRCSSAIRCHFYSRTPTRGDRCAANVSNSTVRCLSNLPLDRNAARPAPMSQTVRAEVSPQSHEWGYKLGSVYIRKVHFRDAQMIKQIQEKVVNRLRQVTSSIKQDGANQVSIITSTAERQAAVEFAKAAAMRPRIVGEALNKVAADPDVEESMFEILEIQKIIDSKARITLIPEKGGILPELMAATGTRTPDASAGAGATIRPK